MTKTKLKWRLADRPTPSEVQELLKSEIISKEEARDILFSHDTEEERDKKSLEGEIKFLRELVQKLSNNNRSTIIETIREVQVPIYRRYPWYQQYEVWCGGSSISLNAQSAGLQANYADNAALTAVNFQDIKTF